MYDCHLHTIHSFDGQNTMRGICELSLIHGMQGICFTDHVDLGAIDHHNPGQLIDHHLDYAAYERDFAAVYERYADRLELARGVEIGLQRELYDENTRALALAKPDFVIGSVHYIDGCDVYGGGYAIGKTQQETYLGYLERILELVRTHDYFHVLGHLDMILRDRSFPKPSFDRTEYHLLIDDILRSLIESGRGIEVNSAAWRYGLPGPHPEVFVIKRYRELGGEIITTGSDSHYVNSVNLYIDRATQILKELGCKQISYFVGGREQKRPI